MGTARPFVYVYIQRKPRHVYEYPAGSAPVAHTSVGFRPVTKRRLCMGYLGHTSRKSPACPADMDLSWNDTESLHKEKLVLTRKDLRWLKKIFLVTGFSRSLPTSSLFPWGMSSLQYSATVACSTYSPVCIVSPLFSEPSLVDAAAVLQCGWSERRSRRS